MPVLNQESILSHGLLIVYCKSIAKSAETSALPAVQHYLKYVLLFGSSSAVVMVLISHLVINLIIIHRLTLSLGICRGQLVLYGLDYTANLILFYYSETGSFNLYQQISENIHKYGIVKQNILQLLFCIQDADTAAGYGICICFGTSTFNISSTAQYHCHIYILYLLNKFFVFSLFSFSFCLLL